MCKVNIRKAVIQLAHSKAGDSAEVLYRSPEFEPEVIIPAGMASVVSYCVFGAYTGWQPLFTIPDLTFTNPWQLGPYLLLALFMVLLAMLYTRSFYGCKRLFDRLPIRRHFQPAIGAFATGLVDVALHLLAHRCGVDAPQKMLAALGFGYSAIQGAIIQDGNMGAVILLIIALGKILTTSLTIGSGGSGGVFGPSMVIGGCGRGALGVLFNDLDRQQVIGMVRRFEIASAYLRHVHGPSAPG
jgi:CIC family chloride channel protein